MSCKYTYKGIIYESYQDLKEALIEEQSSFYFAPFMESVKEKLNTDNELTESERAEIVKSISQEYMLGEDISITLSQLLSAATDNAKELILSKINAGPETAGVYAYLTMLGVPFNDIAKMMTSPAVKWVINRSRKNIYDSKTEFNSLKGAIKELIEGPNVYKYLDLDRMNILSSVIREKLKDKTFIQNLSITSKFRDSEIIKSLLNTDKKKGPIFNVINGIGINRTKWISEKGETSEIDLKIPESDILEFFNLLLKGGKDSKNNNINFIPERHAYISSNNGYYENIEDEEAAYEDGTSYGDNMLPVKVELSRYLEEVIDHLSSAPHQSIESISDFGAILEDSQETVILGRMLSVNQGIKTDSYSQYTFTRSVSDYIIKKSREKIGEKPKLVEKAIITFKQKLIEKGIPTTYATEIVTNFDFLKFLGVGVTLEEKAVYQASGKLFYNDIKSAFNILAVITETPHFNAMLGVVGLMENIKGNLSVKFNLINKLIKKVYDNNIIVSDGYHKTLPEKDFYKIMDFANDTIILKWISELKEARNFTYFSNTYHKSDGKKIIKIKEVDPNGNPLPPSPHIIDIKSNEGRLDFIDMIHEMMLILKEGKTMVNGKLVPNLLLRDSLKGTKNEFIQAYDIDKKKDPITGKNYKFYKLPINVLNINESNSHKFNQYLIGFADLANIQYNGYSVKDLLFLYNTFLHRDKINRESLTKLFEESVGGIEGSLMGDFIEWGGELDWNNEALLSLDESKNYAFDIGDIIIKGMASKIFSKNLKKYKGKYAYSMVFNAETGSMNKQFYEWTPDSSTDLTIGTYTPYTHFSQDNAIALSAGSEIGAQLASNNEYKNLLSEVNKMGIYPINIQINCK